MKYLSDLAIVDVTKGRRSLKHRIDRGEKPSVTLTGFIDRVCGNDDGVSQEFIMAVTENKWDSLVDRREAIHAWIREDCPLGLKMMITPQLVEKLLARLRAAGTGGDVQAAPSDVRGGQVDNGQG